MKNLKVQLDSGFDKVSTKTCTAIISKVRKLEDDFWTFGIKMDDVN